MKIFLRMFPALLAVGMMSASSPGQDRGGGVASSVMRVPDDFKPYDSCLGPRPIVAKGGETKKNEFWQVWADREGVLVYADATTTTPLPNVKVGYLEPFYVSNVNADNTRMSLATSTNLPYEEKIVVAKVVGWVKTENLLLSAFSARSPEMIPKRAFVINDFKEFQPAANGPALTADQIKAKEVTVRKGPSTTAEAVRTLGGSDIFTYIYKYDVCDKDNRSNHGWYLVAQKPKMTAFTKVKDVIIGWVPKARAVEWSTREAYEPDPKRAVAANIFDPPGKNVLLKDGDVQVEPAKREKWAAERWRYVLLENSISAAQKQLPIGFLGELKVVDNSNVPAAPGKSPVATADPELFKTIQKNFDIITNINLIFVVDATKSMGPYLKRLADTADQMVRSLEKAVDERVKLSYGAVAYRDLQNKPAEQLEVFKLTKDAAKLGVFLRGLKEPTPGDDDYPEAMFEGIQVALQKVAIKNQRNIIVLLGDAGNADKKGALDTAVFKKRLNDMYLNVYALHIQRPPGGPEEKAAIDRFEPDIAKLFNVITSVRDSAAGEAPKLVPGAPEFKALVLDRTKPGVEDLAGVADKMGLEIKKQILLANMMAASYQRIIDEGFEKWAKETAVPTGPRGTPPPPSADGTPSGYEVTAAILDIMAQSSGLDPRLFKQLVSNKVQLFTPGSIPAGDAKVNGMRPVYLISDLDLVTSIRSLNEFAGQVDPPHLAEFFKNMVEAATGHVPDDRSNPSEYIAMNSGLKFNSLSEFLSKTYFEIANAKPSEMRKFVELASAAQKKLVLLRDKDEIWFKNYGEKFAWVAAEDLP